VESVMPDDAPQPKSFLQTAKSLRLEGESDWSIEAEEFYNFAAQNLNEAYGDDEPEYSLHLLRGQNPVRSLNR
jgi:hypothetical protein